MNYYLVHLRFVYHFFSMVITLYLLRVLVGYSESSRHGADFQLFPATNYALHFTQIWPLLQWGKAVGKAAERINGKTHLFSEMIE